MMREHAIVAAMTTRFAITHLRRPVWLRFEAPPPFRASEGELELGDAGLRVTGIRRGLPWWQLVLGWGVLAAAAQPAGKAIARAIGASDGTRALISGWLVVLAALALYLVGRRLRVTLAVAIPWRAVRAVQRAADGALVLKVRTWIGTYNAFMRTEEPLERVHAALETARREA